MEDKQNAVPDMKEDKVVSEGKSLSESLLNVLRYIFESTELSIVLLIVIWGFIMSIISPNFFRLMNFQAIVLGLSLDAVMAIGETGVLISGGADIAVGSILAITGIIFGKLSIDLGIPVIISIFLSICLASSIGLFQGFIISKVRINFLIATLCTMIAVRGLSIAISGGYYFSGYPDKFIFFGQGSLGFIPVPFIIMLFIAILVQFLFRYTKFFQQFYFVGGSRESAILSGILVSRVEIMSYVICGLMSGVSGILMAARLGMSSPSLGIGSEFRVIAGCVIGGASLGGGGGTIWGSLLGITLLALVSNALVLLNVDVYWQEVVYGMVLLGAVFVDTIRKEETNRHR